MTSASAVDKAVSPMMAQWHRCKEQARGAILLFRLGDFYEAFGDDAGVIARELGITLTKRHEVPMAGIPHHTVEGYIDRLVNKGLRVAIAEQMDDPKASKGLVRREIVRIVTPGTSIHSSSLAEKSHLFIGAVHQEGAVFGLALIDLTTADVRLMEFATRQELIEELHRQGPKELLTGSSWETPLEGVWIEQQEDGRFTSAPVRARFPHAKMGTMPVAEKAAGALLAYLSVDLSLPLEHLTDLQLLTTSSYLALDRTTQSHLELTRPLRENGRSLLTHLDRTRSAMGGRLLKEWILHPLLSPEGIRERQDKVASLLLHPRERGELAAALEKVRDLERIVMRIETGMASPRDLIALKESLLPLNPLGNLLHQLNFPSLPDLSSIATTIGRAIVDAPPLRLSDGGVFRSGYSEELDELISLKKGRHQWLTEYETSLRETHGIKTLKVGYTQAFGYYIEVSRAQAEKAPPSFERRQTLTSGERFTTPELRELERSLLSAEDRLRGVEAALFHALRREIATQGAAIRHAAQRLAELDVVTAFAEIAEQYAYVRPDVSDSDDFAVEGGRHPVVEALLPPHEFIPNDLEFNAVSHRLLVITGPNMAGKSTYIRQAAILAILAQIGSFVPAKRARIGILDRILTRIGSSDDLSQGQSTFMVEMTETAHILRQATSRSLVILDEIGRGTSTYDGIAIAWAVAEALLIHPERRPKTLFATHYFELTALEKEGYGAVNYNVSVAELKDEITFLHKIVRGAANKSYGIHVAKLAGLPLPVVRRAEALLKRLHTSSSDAQLSLF